MTHKQTIFSLWSAAVAIVLIAMGTSSSVQNILERNSKITINTPLREGKITSELRQQSLMVSRQIFAELYDAPFLRNSPQILGVQDPITLKQEEIADITTSSVVRVFNKVVGTISIPEFDIDFYNSKLIPNGKTYKKEVSALSTGTGFFVDDQGHILTNSHVIDKGSALDSFAQGILYYYGSVIEKQLDAMDIDSRIALREKLIAQYGNNPEEASIAFAQDLEAGIQTYIKQRATLNVKQTLTILDPDSLGTVIRSEENLEKLVDTGFTAKLVDWKPDYINSYRDVAILKIEKTPTPFLTMSSEKVSTGQQVYIIGFPQNAEVDGSDLFNRTMTSGTINSIKKVGATEVYQTDAKISLGSSGSPMLNKKGEVIGIISFLIDGKVGDNFGYAVPIEHAKTLLSKNNLEITENPYMTSFLEGMSLAQQNLCRKANVQFEASQTYNQIFGKDSLQKYVDECSESIAAGTSKDGKFYDFKEKVKGMPVYVWFSIGALVLVTAAAMFFYRRYRHLQAPATFVGAT